jgi:DNA-binding NarL/FixJ family response regulator
MNILENATVLAIDDEPVNLMMLDIFLGSRCKRLITETNPAGIMDLVQNVQPDIILLDILMNEIDGYQVCEQLKAEETTEPIPVIFLSSLAQAADKVKGFKVGGVDYITKPFAAEEVVARIESCLRIHQQIKQSRKLTQAEIAEKAAIYQLSEREIEILFLYLAGKQRHEMANVLNLSENTVKSHIRNLFEKLDAENRAQVLEKARKIGLLD